MKKVFTLAVLLLVSGASFARIWRVNNTAGITADFTDPNTAVNANAVQNGDTIHIEPSPNGYGGISLYKSLVIIGDGYYLDSTNGNPGLQATTNTSQTGGIYLYAGSNGSRFMGLSTTGYSYYQADSVNDITFEKCAVGGIVLNGKHIRGLNIRKAVIGNNGYPTYLDNGTIAGVDIENCIVYNTFTTSNFVAGAGCIIRNCLFNTYSPTINNCYFANNICNANGISITNSIVKNNLFSNTPTLPVGAVNNQFNKALSDICVLTGSADAQYMLKTGSPAIGAGVTINSYTPDCGPFGGPDPYKLSGIPAIPTIYQFTAPSSIPLNQATMNVTISTRSNN